MEVKNESHSKFWVELIAHFPSHCTDSTDKDATKINYIVACVFVAAVTFSRSHCPATIRVIL
jgi:hypothetical protein